MRSTSITANITVFLAITISACQPVTSDDKNLSSKDWSCVVQDSPFSYSACHIDMQVLAGDDYDLQLFWQDNNKQTFLTFDTLVASLPSEQTLAFAMNAGMYNQEYAPIGYTIIEGQEIRALNLNEGGGNFHLLPNGVMWWDKTGVVHITESNALAALIDRDAISVQYATQSGPMLVIDGDIHPAFNENSTSLKFRNGVGVCDNGSIQFVNSDEPVNFYTFASLFKDDLNCSNALFLDGGIASALYAPDIDKHDKKEMGVIVGVVQNK
ncbi:phosphodiester glycosidase family protein [Psychrobacter sp. DM4]|uniref:phosphodiester glycosidase family protein n=1 Tax=Psychrobacter sp. DM4 TaxID=3440637 RepID=UPI003F50A3AB